MSNDDARGVPRGIPTLGELTLELTAEQREAFAAVTGRKNKVLHLTLIELPDDSRLAGNVIWLEL